MWATRNFWGQFGLVVGVALTVRLVAAVVIDRQVSRTPGRICLIEGDAAGYWDLGCRIAHGEDYELYVPPRRVLRMPGFPVVLAVSHLLFGANIFAARCLLAMIGALACGLVFGLGRTLSTEAVGLIAGLATALSPPLIAFSPLLLSETTFAAALTGNLWALALLWRPSRTSSSTSQIMLSILIGVLGAVTVYMRPTWLPIIPLAAFGRVLIAPRVPLRWIEAATMAAALLVCLSPWVYRNARVTGHPIITTLWDGPSLYDGLHPAATGKSDMTFFEQDQLLDHMTEWNMNKTYRERAWQFAFANPGRSFQLAIIKAQRYWSIVPNADQFADPRLKWGLALSTVPLFLFAAIGAWRSRRDVVLLAITAGPVLFFAAVHLLYVSSIRYRLPAEYPLWILAAVGIEAVWRRWRTRPVAEATT